jgi:hypothetical protein
LIEHRRGRKLDEKISFIELEEKIRVEGIGVKKTDGDDEEGEKAQGDR